MRGQVSLFSSDQERDDQGKVPRTEPGKMWSCCLGKFYDFVNCVANKVFNINMIFNTI